MYDIFQEHAKEMLNVKIINAKEMLDVQIINVELLNIIIYNSTFLIYHSLKVYFYS